MAERDWLFDNRHDDTFAALEGTEDAGAEVLDMVIAHLAEHHGSAPEVTSADKHPLETAARMVPEDLLLLKPRPRKDDEALLDWTLEAAALAFPAHWVLAEKMGRPLAGIHEPVPHYGERLETPMDRFFTNMKVGPISHRWNWSVMTSHKLFTPHRSRRTRWHRAPALTRFSSGWKARRSANCPRSGMILFTIRTYAEPLTRWAAMPGAVASLLELLDGMTPEMRDYKGFRHV